MCDKGHSAELRQSCPNLQGNCKPLSQKKPGSMFAHVFRSRPSGDLLDSDRRDNSGARVGERLEFSQGREFIQVGRKPTSPRGAGRRFLAQRGLTPNQLRGKPKLARSGAHSPCPGQESFTAAWQAIGPSAVSTSSYGLVTGRVAALAHSSDPTGNRLYIVNFTGGGVWFSQNAAVRR